MTGGWGSPQKTRIYTLFRTFIPQKYTNQSGTNLSIGIFTFKLGSTDALFNHDSTDSNKNTLFALLKVCEFS